MINQFKDEREILTYAASSLNGLKYVVFILSWHRKPWVY